RRDRASDDSGIAGKPASPERVAQNRHRRRLEKTFFRGEGSPERELYPEHVEEVVGHAHVAEPLRIAGASQRLPAAEIEEGEVPGQCLEARVLFTTRLGRVSARRAR